MASKLLCSTAWLLGLGSGAAAGYAPVDPAEVLDILSKMSLREKLEETGIGGFTESDWHKLSFFSVPTLLPQNWYDLKSNDRLKLKGLRTRDGPRGMTCLLCGAFSYGHPCPSDATSPSFPAQNLRAMTWDVDLEEEFGTVTGEIAKLLDIDVGLLPCVNILPWLNSGRGQESYGEDPFFSGKMGAAVVRGIQSRGVMATAKHFLANNIENSRWHVSAEMDDKTLHEVYLKQWAVLISESSPEFVMTSYNRVQGNWSNVNPKFLHLLRNKLGFEGSVMTDWLATMEMMPRLVNGTPFGWQDKIFGRHSTSLEAGVDMEMPFNTRHTMAIRDLAGCLGTELDLCRTTRALDRNVAHLLRSKLRYGLVGKTKKSLPVAAYNETKYNELSLRISRRGITLLKNEQGFLPKPRGAVSSVVVMGSAKVLELGDVGSSAQKPSGGTINVLEGLESAYGKQTVTFLEASEARSDVVRAADLVVMDVGTNHTFEGEFIPPPINTGGDRKYLHLHHHELDMIRAVADVNPNIVVAISSGQVIIVEDFIDSVKAVLWMGYPGPHGGRALADIIMGDVNPSGRMTSATPRAASDWVPDGITLQPWTSAEVVYPYAHGFKHMWGARIQPRFPMGWGLSYTSFSFADPFVRTSSSSGLDLVVGVRLANTGQRKGRETVQVYVACRACRHRRLPLLLVGFGGAELEPGESRDVAIEISAKEFAVYDVSSEKWLLEKASYTILVGPNADEASLHAVEYSVDADVHFDYAGAQATPDVAGAGELDCSAYACVEDADFLRQEMLSTVTARVYQLISLASFALVLLPCIWCCCGGSQKANKEAAAKAKQA